MRDRPPSALRDLKKLPTSSFFSTHPLDLDAFFVGFSVVIGTSLESATIWSSMSCCVVFRVFFMLVTLEEERANCLINFITISFEGNFDDIATCSLSSKLFILLLPSLILFTSCSICWDVCKLASLLVFAFSICDSIPWRTASQPEHLEG